MLSINLSSIGLTSQFLIEIPSGCHTECHYKLIECDASIQVFVKDIENETGELAWISAGEHLLVDRLKFLPTEDQVTSNQF